MMINDLLEKHHISKYRLGKEAGIPHTTLNDICSGKTSLENVLPDYLQHDLDEYKKGLKTHSSLLDCLWGELYGSINMAEISDGSITPEHANYLRQKYLYEVKK